MQRLLFIVGFILFFCSCQPAINYEDFPSCYRTGDNHLWASPDYDSKDWSLEKQNTGNEIFWVRTPVQLKENPHGALGVQIVAFGAFEVYWDGVLIGHNGKVGDKAHPEIPGSEGTSYIVPDSLSQIGSHLVALRVSQTYFSELQRGTIIKLDNYLSLIKNPLIIMSFMNLMAGAFLIAAIYYFFLYLNSNRKNYSVLIFALICLLFFALLTTEYLKFYIEIPYPHFFLRLKIIGWLTFVIALLVPLYFTIQFHFKRKLWLLALLFLTLIVIYVVNYEHYDKTAVFYGFSAWITAMPVVLNATYKGERGAVIVLIGLLLSAVFYQFLIYDFSLFISFMTIVLCMLYLHTIRAKMIEEEHQSSLLLSSRLQLELIKKNIQPHFIKNTLTSLMDWVEESPKEGAAFIQALAAEFDIMNDIAEAALIPIRQEIELCKIHLTVMHFRKELRYEWEDSGIEEAELIPPAIIHTLLENGITHTDPLEDGSMHFKLAYSRFETYKEYQFHTTGQHRVSVKKKEGGNGFRYIKARLTESYAERWEFSSGQTSQGWLTTIKIYERS